MSGQFAQPLTQTLGIWLEHLSFILLLLTVSFAPLMQSSIEGWGLLGLRLLPLSALMLWLLAGSLRGQLRLPPFRLSLPLTAYLLLVLLSTLASPYYFGSVQSAITTLCMVAGFYLTSVLAIGAKRRQWLLAALFVGTAVTVGYGLSEALRLDGATRISSFYDNPNYYAGFLDLLTPLVLGLLLFRRQLRDRALLVLLLGVLFISVGLTYSRGGWVAVGCSSLILLFVWAFRERSVRRFLGLALILSVLLLAGLSFVARSPRLEGSLSERLQDFIHVLDDGNVTGRLALFRASLPLIAAQPWLGVGPGNFDDTITQYRPAHITDGASATLHGYLTHALNDYLQIASETGILSLLAWAGFWLLVLMPTTTQRHLVARGLRYGLSAGIIALLIHGLVDSNLTFVPGNALLAYVAAGFLHPAA